MEAMPPIDYTQLARKSDLEALDVRLAGHIAELRGELKTDQANLLKGVLAGQVATMMMLGAWVTSVV